MEKKRTWWLNVCFFAFCILSAGSLFFMASSPIRLRDAILRPSPFTSSSSSSLETDASPLTYPFRQNHAAAMVSSSNDFNQDDEVLKKGKRLWEGTFVSTSSFIEKQTFLHYLDLCNAHTMPSEASMPFNVFERRINQRNQMSKDLWIRNATIYDGLGNVLPQTDVYIQQGVIHQIGKQLPYQQNDHIDVVNADGQPLTPGIVDMHSHAGVSPAPYFLGNEDSNEEDQPIHPELRSLDSFNLYDYSLPYILAGGVTSTLVIPGSANLIGGEGYVFKTPIPKSNLVEDMLIQTKLTHETSFKTGAPFRRWMKMACGENPKRTYGIDQHKSPYTRMSSAHHMRKALFEASKVKESQDEWCTIARHLKPMKLPKIKSETSSASPSYESEKNKEDGSSSTQYYLHPKGHYPTSLEWDTLVSLLRGQVGLHWHCYLSFDVETQLRLMHEFNISVKAFHHALDLYKITPLLKQHHIGVAIFADHWAYKPEAYTASVHAPKTFWDAGVPMAFKSDHPVLNAQYLAYESSKAIQYGLGDHAWLSSITSVPASLLDLNHRIGKIQVGMDADLVLWNAPPMAIGARPTQVYVDGQLAFKATSTLNSFTPSPPLFLSWPSLPTLLHSKRHILFLNATVVVHHHSKQNMQLLLDPKGVVLCLDVYCDASKFDTVKYDLQNAIITPPLVLAATLLGFSEIEQEPMTNEGYMVSHDFLWTKASEGWLAGGKLEYAAANQGVLLAISAPPTLAEASNLRGSLSGLFVLNQTLPTPLHEPVALHVSNYRGSFAEYLAMLRMKLVEWQTMGIPLVLRVNQASHLASLLKLKKKEAPNMTWILQGANEAEWVLNELASTPNVMVLLTSSRCAPYTWDSRRCSTDMISKLKHHGIPFILSTSPHSISDTRNLRFEAGWARRLANLNFTEMVNLVTLDVLRAFNLTQHLEPYKIGEKARFLIWNGDFGEVDTQLMYVIDGTTPEIVHVPKHL